MSWGAEGIPRDVEPAGGGKELVGIFTGLEEGDEALELGGILGADIGSLRKSGSVSLIHFNKAVKH